MCQTDFRLVSASSIEDVLMLGWPSLTLNDRYQSSRSSHAYKIFQTTQQHQKKIGGSQSSQSIEGINLVLCL